MKIALLTDSDVFAGTERHIHDLAIGLRDTGHSVLVACPEPSALGDRMRSLGIEHVTLQKGKMWDKPAIAVLCELLQSGRADILHAHNGRTALSAVLAIRRAGIGRCVATQHFISPNRDRLTGVKKLVIGRVHRWVNNRIDRHIAISQAVERAMISRGDVSVERISVVLNGIVDPVLEVGRSREEVRNELGIPADQPMIACAARLEPEKGIDQLIDAMQIVGKSHPQACCVIAGDGSLRDQLQAKIDRNKLQHNIRLLGFRSDVLSIVRAADLLVLPAAAEPFGLVVVEAMALARPVVAVNAGGPAEIVLHERTGLLIQPDNGDAMATLMAAAMVRLLNNAQERNMMSANGRRRFETDFTVHRMARDMAAVYERAML